MLYTTQANPANEPGGMNDVLYKLYRISKDEKHLKLAQIFDRKWFLMPLANNVDILSGLHSNTHIVLVNGFSECYEITKNPIYYNAVTHFWDMLAYKHAYVNGSSSGPRPNVTTPTSLTSEHWGRPGQLSNTLTGEIAETCVSHNTQRLTSKLFEWTCKPRYADWYMNAFYNSIMALQNAKTGEYVYHLPLGSPRRRKFLNSYSDFRCCNGSSIEAFSLLNKNIYFHDDKNVWVNLYIPTVLDWKERHIKISQEGDFIRDQKAELTVASDSAQFLSLNLFIPSWGKGAKVYVNNHLQGVAAENSFFNLNREWRNCDCIRVQFDFKFRVESIPDDKNTVAIFYGPLLLSFQSAEEISLYGEKDDILSNLEVSDRESLLFVLNNGGKKYYLKPLLSIEDEPYSVYVRINKLYDAE